MTKEQMLQIIDRQYGHVSQDWYTPAEGNISFGEIGKITQELLKKYQITDKKITEIYPFYLSKESGGRPPDAKDTWTVHVHIQRSDYDYALVIDAAERSLMQWSRYPKDYYSEEGHDRLAVSTMDAYDKEPEEEAVLEAARNYASEVLALDKSKDLSVHGMREDN